MSCGMSQRHSSDPTLLWLWYRLAPVALIQLLAWELPYAMTGTPRKHLLSGECRCGTSTDGSEVHGVKCVFIRDCYTYHL